MTAVDVWQIIEFLIIYPLLTWRLTSLIVNEAGPFDLFQTLRNTLGVSVEFKRQYKTLAADSESFMVAECKGRNVIARMLCCFKCTSVWIAAAVVLIFQRPIDTGYDVPYYLERVLVMSAIAILIDRVVIALEARANGKS